MDCQNLSYEFTDGPPLVTKGFVKRLRSAVRNDTGLVSELQIGTSQETDSIEGFYIFIIHSKT